MDKDKKTPRLFYRKQVIFDGHVPRLMAIENATFSAFPALLRLLPVSEELKVKM